uniref:Uncharacterized protein n=1 Tax=Panagrolaimus superbus TaxID=310955 RepID=A0A914Z009_9BILA
MLFNVLIAFGFWKIALTCGPSSPIIIEKDEHLFDDLFFNVTDPSNDSELLLPEPFTLPTTSTATPTTTTLAPHFPLLFSLPKIFPGFSRSKWMPFGKHSDYVPRLLTNPTWRFQCSPPVSWTYCWPHCGSGDQALDADNAVENAQLDISSAVTSAIQTLKLGIIPEDQIKIRFSPKNTLLEEFGDYFDRNNLRYRVVRNSVRYFYNKESPGNFTENIDEVILHFLSNY